MMSEDFLKLTLQEVCDLLMEKYYENLSDGKPFSGAVIYGLDTEYGSKMKLRLCMEEMK